MSPAREARRARAAAYLAGRTLEQALAAWRADYDASTFRERRRSLARLGALIRQLSAESDELEAVQG